MAQHLALPITVGTDGHLVCLTQDSQAEIAQSVRLLLATEPGDRAAVPDYGLDSPLGRGVDVDEIADVIEEWEPRADPALVEVVLDTLTEQHVTVQPAAPDTTTSGTDSSGVDEEA